MKQDVSNEILGAFVDNELDCSDNRTIADEIKTNPEMAARAQAMLDLKTAIKSAYPEQKGETFSAPSGRKNGTPYIGQAIAAGLFVVFGLVIGASVNSGKVYQQPVSEGDSLYGIKVHPVSQQESKVLLHISSAELDKLDFLLTKTERMLRDSRNSQYDLNIDIIANSDGINLLRTSTTPYAQRIHKLQQQYKNLQFIACQNTIKRLKKNGQNVRMIEGVKADRPALDTIVNRIDQGWTYVKI